MNSRCCIAVLAVLIGLGPTARAQFVLSGRLAQPRWAGSEQLMPLSAVFVFASAYGSGAQALACRSWESDPAGWFRLSGQACNYTVVFSSPAHFMRPIVLTNQFFHDGQVLERAVRASADYAVFDEGDWDREPAFEYYQPFVARSTSLTQVGFRLAHDGVDGMGPGNQNLLVSVHQVRGGDPEHWPQIGPTVPVMEVDSGGAKNYLWSAAWDSGQVPLQRGQVYAVRLRAEKQGGVFQPFWRTATDNALRCYRVAAQSRGSVDRQLWMSVAGDGDGLLIPYNKRVQRQFNELTRFSRKWSQTYVAQGRSLAAVLCYAATSGVQPPLSRQRVAVRVRRSGCNGPLVGIEKIGIGNGNYTGDASWGLFLVAFAPGEVRLEPGETYAIELESIENYHTLHGFVNSKGQVSDDRPGFNPYRKHPRDSYDMGRAYLNGTEPMDYDLDMQIIEYEHAADNWHLATERTNLLNNGDMEAQGAWSVFGSLEGVSHGCVPDAPGNTNRIMRIAAGPQSRQIDGGLVQQVAGLTCLETYRLSAKVRCSWAQDDRHQCFVGYDPTGQTRDPRAESIVWQGFPPAHGIMVSWLSEPIRPAENSISVWLRVRAKLEAGEYPFHADFDNTELRQVCTGVPQPEMRR